MEKVISGILQFQSSSYQEHKQLFDELATGQSPEVLVITCADSRIDPSLITQTDPGDLFIIRNAGNIVPTHAKQSGGVTASIEFGVAALGVKHIVVCGHTDCGAMKGAIDPSALSDLPHVQNWLDNSRAAVETVKAKHGKATLAELDHITEENVLLQLQHLKTHPTVAAGLAAGDIELHGWVYDIKHGTVRAFDESKEAFADVAEVYADFVSRTDAVA